MCVPGSESGLDRNRRIAGNGAKDANLGKLRFVYGYNAMQGVGWVREALQRWNMARGVGTDAIRLSYTNLLRTVEELRSSQDVATFLGSITGEDVHRGR